MVSKTQWFSNLLTVANEMAGDFVTHLFEILLNKFILCKILKTSLKEIK